MHVLLTGLLEAASKRTLFYKSPNVIITVTLLLTNCDNCRGPKQAIKVPGLQVMHANRLVNRISPWPSGRGVGSI